VYRRYADVVNWIDHDWSLRLPRGDKSYCSRYRRTVRPRRSFRRDSSIQQYRSRFRVRRRPLGLASERSKYHSSCIYRVVGTDYYYARVWSTRVGGTYPLLESRMSGQTAYLKHRESESKPSVTYVKLVSKNTFKGSSRNKTSGQPFYRMLND